MRLTRMIMWGGVAGGALSAWPLLAQEAPAAADPSVMPAADVAWAITATALVFFMQAGFAMLEGGMTRTKNSVNVLMKNYTDMIFGTIVFFLFGYGIMFGTNPSGWFGVDHYVPNHLSGSDGVFFMFQLVFAATAATIISGAIAERTRYWAYIIATLGVTGIIYPVFGSWAWGSHYNDTHGWLSALGFIDFAGSTVVHSVGGWAALAAIMVLGPRLGRFAKDGTPRDIPGHNMALVALGGFILWFGWFGFNGGSTLAAIPRVGTIILNTQLAACAGTISALFVMALTTRKVLMTVSINGGLGGLVAITAGCNNVTPLSALVIGTVAGVITFYAGELLLRFKLDDVVGAIPVHGFCGAWGTLGAGIFDEKGMFNAHTIGIQALGVATCFVFTFSAAYILFKGIDLLVGLRVSTIHEQRGLDYSEHYEIGYPEFVEVLHDEKM